MAVLAVLLNDTETASTASFINANRKITWDSQIHPKTLPENSSYCQQVNTLERSQYVTKIGILTLSSSGFRVDPKPKVVPKKPRVNINRFQQNSDTLLDLIYHMAIANFTLGDLTQKERLIVKLNQQCQQVDHEKIDRAIENHRQGNFDYCSHTNNGKDFHGAHTETMTFEAIQEAWQQAVLGDERQKIMPYLYRRQHRFSIGSF